MSFIRSILLAMAGQTRAKTAAEQLPAAQKYSASHKVCDNQAPIPLCPTKN